MPADYTEISSCILPSVAKNIAQTVRSAVLESAADNLTAHVGGGQPNGTPIKAKLNRFTVVTNSGDSATLPPSEAGVSVWVRNDGANPMNIFPASGDAINSLGANNAFSLTAGHESTFHCYTAGFWHAAVSN